jgi:hypothetical protein
MSRLLICLGVALAILGTANQGLAQTTGSGSIRGYIKDEQGAVLPGVTVSATSPDAPGHHGTVSDGTGFFRLLDLPPADYTLTAELQGFAKFVRPNLSVGAGLNLGVDIVLKVGSLTEVVEVKADTPMLDVEKPIQSINISGELKRAIPLTTNRDWMEFLSMVPGVVGSGNAFRVHGTEFDSHVLLLDGADMASANSNSNQMVQLGGETMQDAQVKTSGMDASAPLGYGAVVSMVSQSGTNAYKGAAGGLWQARRFNGVNVPGGTSAQVDRLQPDLAFGGPILKNKLWFFSTYRYVLTHSGLARTPAQLATLQGVYPAYSPFDNVTKSNVLFVKTTGQIAQNHQFTAFYQRDVTPAGSNQTLATTPDYQSVTGGPAYNVRLESVWGSSLVTRIGVSYNEKNTTGLALPDKPARTVNAKTVASSGVLTGSGAIAYVDNYVPYSTVQDNRKTTLTADATFHKVGWIGSHEFQGGVYFQPKLHSESRLDYVNSGSYSIEQDVLNNPLDPSAGYKPFNRVYYDTANVPQTSIDASDLGVFIQDAWRPLPQLTVSAGLRADFIRARDVIYNVALEKSTNIGPRFGINYSVTKDHRNIIHASLVRVHDSPSGNSAPSVSGNNRAGFRSMYDLNLDGVFETEVDTPGLTALTPSRTVQAATYKQPHIDEWTAGFSRQFPGLVTVDATFVQRLYKDRPTWVEYNAIYTNGVFQGYKDVTQNMLYYAANNVWNWFVYSDFEVSVSKRTKKLQVMASYTKQWRHEGGTWQPGDPAAIIQPNAFANDKNLGPARPSSQSTSEANSLANARIPSGAQWDDYQVRIAANYLLPWHFVVASSWTYAPGRWSGPITMDVTPDTKFGPATLTLSNGRVVTNPLATSIRFTCDTRSDCQFEPQPQSLWNLRLGRDFRIGKHQQVQLAVDIFNVPNLGKLINLTTVSTISTNVGYKTLGGTQSPRSGIVSARYTF